MKLIVNKDRTVIPIGTWGTVNENDYEILEFEFPEELEGYNKRIVYYLGDERVWDTIVNNKAYITNAITTKDDVKAYVWCTKTNTEREADTDFRTMLFDMHFYENENADGIVPTEQQVDGFNTMLTAMNAKIDEVDALEQTIETAEAQRQEAEATRASNENTRETNEFTRESNEQTRQSQEADRERRTDEAIGNIEDKTAEYNANAETKTNAFDSNATSKTNTFNQNATEKTTAFNSNASDKTTAFDNNASSKTSAFNSNAETKTNTFNTNATNKTNAFNSNATQKTTTFNNNASTKTSEFNTNAENKTTAFNDNATQKTTNFDNNASEKTDEFNTNAQNKIDEYDEHIVDYQAQIDELQEEVEELSENTPWNTTEQATELTVTDAAKYSKNKMNVFGNTEQAQYTGKQLFKDEYIDVPNRNQKNATLSAGTYTLATCDGENFSKNVYFTLFDTNENLITEDGHITSSNVSFLFSSTSNLYYGGSSVSYITFTIDSDYILSIGLLNSDNTRQVVLVRGTNVDRNYEPYVGGVPAPNPNYPQNIHVVTGDNTIGVTGKNLCKSFANGTNTGRYNVSIYIEADFEVGKKYVISFIDKSVGNTYYRNEHFMTNASPYSITSTGTRQSYYFECSKNDKSNTSTYKAGSGFIILKNYVALSQLPQFEDVQVEEVETYNVPATSYEPYTHRDYSLNLGPLELREIGDYQDYIYKENGNWYKYGKIFEDTYSNIQTGNITRVASYIKEGLLGYVFSVNTLHKQGALNAEVFCTSFSPKFLGLQNDTTDVNSVRNSEGIAIHTGNTNQIIISIDSNRLNDDNTATFDTYMRTINPKIMYILNTPVVTQITDETLISQLEAIYNHLALVKGTNHITITPSDLAPYMKLSYMQDINILREEDEQRLNNIESRLSLLE